MQLCNSANFHYALNSDFTFDTVVNSLGARLFFGLGNFISLFFSSVLLLPTIAIIAMYVYMNVCMYV